MSDKSLEERAKELYRYFVTKEGEMPDMNNDENRKAVEYLFDNHYLIKKYCASPQTTPKGNKWAMNKRVS